jgi:hypothetical protein
MPREPRKRLPRLGDPWGWVTLGLGDPWRLGGSGCQVVVAPKVVKFRKQFADRVKREATA